VNRRMNQNDVGPSGTKAISGAPAMMAGAIVCNQEHASGWGFQRRRPLIPI
jgi:hypothetical protein